MATDPSKKRELHLALALMVLIWGFGYTVAKVALTELDPFVLAAARVLMATVLLLGIFAFQKQAPVRLTWRDATMLVFLGITGVSFNQVLFVKGLSLTVPSHSSLVVATGPIFVLLLAAIIHEEPIGIRKVAGILLSFAGVTALTVTPDFGFDRSYLTGDLITLGGVFSFSAYTVVSRPIVQRFGALRTTVYSFVVGSLLIIPAAFVLAGPNPSPLTTKGVLAVIYMAVFASVITYVIFYKGLGELGAARMSALSYFQPLLAIGISLIMGQEQQIAARTIAGGVLIFAGLFVAERG